MTEERLKDTLSNLLSNILKELIDDTVEIDFKKITNSCQDLFNYTYLNPPNYQKFKFYYAKKLFLDSPKSKNDFLTYENCLNGYEISEYSTQYKKQSQKMIF